MLAVAGLSQAMGVELFSGWIPDTTTTTGSVVGTIRHIKTNFYLKSVSINRNNISYDKQSKMGKTGIICV